MLVSSSDQDIKIITQPKCFTPITIKNHVLNQFILADIIKREILSFHSGVVEVTVFWDKAPRLTVVGARPLGITYLLPLQGP